MLVLHHDGIWIKRGWLGRGDAFSIWEVFYKNIYELNRVRGVVTNIVDVGGHIGVFSAFVHRTYPTARIAICEPVPVNVECIRANCGRYAEIYEGAVTEHESPVLVTDCVEMSNSTNTSYVVGGGMGADSVVPRVSLETLGAGRRISILKLDCEGCEYHILNCKSLALVDNLFCELHAGERWSETRSALSAEWDCELTHYHERADVGGGTVLFFATRKVQQQ